jgi:PAS domain S-box-containing protein
MQWQTVILEHNLYRQFFEQSAAAMLLLDPSNAQIIAANLAAARFYGYSREVLQTLLLSDLSLKATESLVQQFGYVVENGQVTFTSQNRLASGELRNVEVQASFARSGEEIIICAVIHDITQRKQAEDALRQSEEHLRSLIASMDDLVFTLDLDGRFQFYHEMPRVKHDTPLTSLNPYLGQRFQDILPASVVGRFTLAIARVTSTFETQHFEYSLSEDGGERYYSARISPLVGPALKLMGVTVVSREITESVQARLRQERLFDLEQLHRHINSLFWKSEETEGVINRTLALAGEFFDVSHAFVTVFHEGERLMDMTYEYCADGAASEITTLHGVPYEQVVPSLVPLLKREGSIASQDLSDLPVDYRTLLEKLGVCAILILPIFVERRLYGFVGFNDARRIRLWLPEEISTVRTIAESYARAIERAQAQAALIQARDTAIRSARLKSEFMSNMSHEVRTPMTGVIGMLELLLETELGAEQRGFADTAYTSAHNLLSILDDILDFSKIEAGKIVLEMKPIDIPHVVDEVVTTLMMQASRKQIDLRVDLPDDLPPRVYGDPTRLRQVLMNLTSNAIKFTPSGSVTIGVRNPGSPYGRARLEFEVRDTGIGIALEQQTRIFDSFVQADGSTTRRYGGSGLGLSICKQLVQLMGGQIAVESTPGKGSSFTFTITFPALSESSRSTLESLHVLIVDSDLASQYVLAQQIRQWEIHVHELSRVDEIPAMLREMAADQTRVDVAFCHVPGSVAESEAIIAAMRLKLPSPLPRFVLLADDDPVQRRAEGFDQHMRRPIQGAELYDLLMSLRPSVEEPPVAEPTALPAPTQATILLAEDNATSQRVVAQALHSAGYSVDIAGNGYEALNLINVREYDLILMDIHMPEMDGLTTTRHIRALPNGKAQIPIIALTASVMPEEQQEYFAAGVNAVWSKPFSLSQLRSNVRDWLSHKRS